MQLYVGTSGFSYKEWKGSFYPQDIKATEMLAGWSSTVSAAFEFRHPSWAERIRTRAWKHVFFFFKHEQIAPGLAERLLGAGQ